MERDRFFKADEAAEYGLIDPRDPQALAAAPGISPFTEFVSGTSARSSTLRGMSQVNEKEFGDDDEYEEDDAFDDDSEFDDPDALEDEDDRLRRRGLTGSAPCDRADGRSPSALSHAALRRRVRQLPSPTASGPWSSSSMSPPPPADASQ